jgi:SAM-dependent methyltransferase
MRQRRPFLLLLIGGLALVLLSPLAGCAQKPDSDAPSAAPPLDSVAAEKDVPYVTTPQRVVERMLAMADVSEDDVVYDLGSGDGRFVITAAQQFGARGVGVEIDPQLVRQARSQARLAGVTDRVTFRQGNLFETDLREATVVTLYLEPDLNLRLRPKLFLQLDPGDRVVSHDFDMGAWTPTRVDTVAGSIIHLWTIPAQLPDSLSTPPPN